MRAIVKQSLHLRSTLGLDRPQLPPDLEINVSLERSGPHTQIVYQLHSHIDDLDLHHRIFHGPTLEDHPNMPLASWFESIERLRSRLGEDHTALSKGDVTRKLSKLGQRLFRDLFPADLKKAYRNFRDKVSTILLTSEEPWIPWEFVKPFDASQQPAVDDDFLCLRFRFTRWLSTSAPPRKSFQVDNLACILPRSSLEDFPRESRNERQILEQLAFEFPDVEDLSPRDPSVERVEDLLQSEGIDLLHYVGHSKPAQGLDKTSILLDDGRSWSPSDLEGKLASSIAARRPLVFFNSCGAARQSWSFTGLSGWAEAWIRKAHCGAFVGPFCSVSSKKAEVFARSFYASIAEGCTIGEATHVARLALFESSRCLVTALGFAAFSHPNATVVFDRKS